MEPPKPPLFGVGVGVPEAYWVGGGGYFQLQPACQASAWRWEQLCVGVGGRKGATHCQLFALTVCQAMGVAQVPVSRVLGPRTHERVHKPGPLVWSWSV